MSIDKTANSTKLEAGIHKPAGHKLWLWIIGMILFTLFIYAPVFSDEKEFTNWDDDGYVTNQPLITSLDGAHLKKMFAPSSAVMSNYHPLTMLSLAVNYQQGYDEDTKTISISPFVKTNLLVHLLNTALVFLLIYHLGKQKSPLLAALAALFFAIHPLHVESVAWISERKDVLYCFFFLLSCLTYLRYLDTQKMAWLGVSFLFFIASCLSKAMAVPLPFVLLLTDYLYRRRFGIRVLLEKAPYLLVALIAGLHAVTLQKNAITGSAIFTFGQRILFAGTAFSQYCIRLLAPLHLSAFYPYPDVATNGSLPAMYYVMPFMALAIIVIPLIIVRRKAPAYFRPLVWGLGFFIVMIALVLPFMGVGNILMADRYTYVSSIGLLFLLPSFLQPVLEHSKFRKLSIAVMAAFICFYGMKTYQRIAVWTNSHKLWADVIDQYPIAVQGGRAINLGAKTAYKNMGDYYIGQNQYDSAFHYYHILTTAGTKDAEVWNNLGNIYSSRNDLPNALDAFNKAIALDATKPDIFLIRAVVLANSGNYKGAVADLDKVLQLRPGDEQATAMRESMRKGIKD